MTIKFIVLFVICVSLISSANVNRRKMTECAEIPEGMLEEILGPAYNSRYMSIDLPPEIDSPNQKSTAGVKRAPSSVSEFYVDDDFFRDLGDVPAWDTKHIRRERHFSKRHTQEDDVSSGDKTLSNNNSHQNNNSSSVKTEFTHSDVHSSTGDKMKVGEIFEENRYETKEDNMFLFVDKQLGENYRRKVLVKRNGGVSTELLTGKLAV